MKALVVYDSMYGNTEKIARAIADAIGSDARVRRAGETRSFDLEQVDVLVVGSPTQGFMATKSVQAFIDNLTAGMLRNKKVAAFDTRMATADVGAGLKLIMKVGGYAARRMAASLKKKGGDLAMPAAGFFVNTREGPLKEGELERAAGWAREIISK